MKKLMILLIASLAFLTACDTLRPIGDATQDAAHLNYYWMEGSVINFVDTAELSEDEASTIIHSMVVAENVRQKLVGYYDNPELLVADIDTIRFQYVRLRAAYLDVREIILAHQDEYSAEAWLLFTLFDARAISLDVNFDELNSAINVNASALSTLATVSSLLKIMAVL